ncbi:MAG: hypothetical protein HKP58_08025 [Desulfatitalea sp.]|nr:hypothetical protein [Desulfatitalea sp.]
MPHYKNKSKHNSEKLSDRLWEGVWKGLITNDTFNALRRGIENRFKVNTPGELKTGPGRRGKRTIRRGAFSAWKGSLPYSGRWFKLPMINFDDDLIAFEELKKDRVRLLLDRYGILFKELLQREQPVLSWAALFRSLRLMELSGELLAGYFFENIPGPQFVSHEAFRKLQSKLPEESIFWINASEPASLCGLQIDAFKGTLPKRLSGTHLVYQGKKAGTHFGTKRETPHHQRFAG